MSTQIIFIVVCGLGLLLIAAATHFSGQGSLDNIKSKTVGDGQHGTARWATKREIQKTFAHVPFQPELWRKGKNLPKRKHRSSVSSKRNGRFCGLCPVKAHFNPATYLFLVNGSIFSNIVLSLVYMD